MSEAQPSTPTDVKTGEELAEGLCALIASEDAESVRHVIRDRLRRTEPWIAKAHNHRKLLANAVVALGKQGALEALVGVLDRADNEALRRWQRDNPDLRARHARTADHLRLFLAESGTPTSRSALTRALRTAEGFAGAEAAEQLAEHLASNDERAAGRVVERLLDRFFGQPESDEVRGLRAELDAFLKLLLEKDLAQPTARAIARHAAEASRRLGPIGLMDLHDQLKDLMKRYATDSLASRWQKAVGREALKGRPLGRELAKQLKAGKVEDALDHLGEDVLAPLDDRFVFDAGEGSRQRLDECLDEVAKAGQLEALIQAAYEADLAFQNANPHVIFVGTLYRLKSAIDRFGKDASKELFAKPFATLEERLAKASTEPAAEGAANAPT